MAKRCIGYIDSLSDLFAQFQISRGASALTDIARTMFGGASYTDKVIRRIITSPVRVTCRDVQRKKLTFTFGLVYLSQSSPHQQ